jgi:hypothetical protein
MSEPVSSNRGSGKSLPAASLELSIDAPKASTPTLGASVLGAALICIALHCPHMYKEGEADLFLCRRMRRAVCARGEQPRICMVAVWRSGRSSNKRCKINRSRLAGKAARRHPPQTVCGLRSTRNVASVAAHREPPESGMLLFVVTATGIQRDSNVPSLHVARHELTLPVGFETLYRILH